MEMFLYYHGKEQEQVIFHAKSALYNPRSHQRYIHHLESLKNFPRQLNQS
jgi:hypothetical protein